MTPARGEGVRHFRHQRLTAVMLMPLVLAFLVMCVAFVGADYLTVRSAFKMPFVFVCVLIFVEVAVYHMRLGMQAILEDYVSGTGTLRLLLRLNIAFAFIVGTMAAYALVRLTFLS